MCHFFLPRCQHNEISEIAREFYKIARSEWLGDDWSSLDDEGQLARLLLLDDSKPGANSLKAIRATGRFLQDIRVAMFKWEHARKRQAALERSGRPHVQASEAPKMKNIACATQKGKGAASWWSVRGARGHRYAENLHDRGLLQVCEARRRVHGARRQARP